MARKLFYFFAFLLFTSSYLYSQKNPVAKDWYLQKPGICKNQGINLDNAYKFLNGKPSKTVIVAVIDGGTEIKHEDLKDVIWTNSKEIVGNGIDDDNNGYVDDIHGWNYIGGKESDVIEDTYEFTRIYAKLKPLYESENGAITPYDTTSLQYKNYKRAKSLYYIKYNENKNNLVYLDNILNSIPIIVKSIGKENPTVSEIKNYEPQSEAEKQGKFILLVMAMRGDFKDSTFINQITSVKSVFEKNLKYYLNLDFDSRQTVGDNYENLNDHNYGNNHVSGPTDDHGTHVAGIIAAKRNNSIGMNGIADNVKIMVLRVVPDGDERDKDIANAIRYAVDNGASVINMSFGKDMSPHKSIIDEAVLYALSKDVLLVHAAGNDGENIDIEENYPNPRFEKYSFRAPNWIEVGASANGRKKKLAASFSNYGQNNVDVFAPGVSIYSSIPNSKYAYFDGTSMASPVVAGLAALIRSYYPNLTAQQTKEIILESSVKFSRSVRVPGAKNKISFSKLSKAGGIINAKNAVKLAEERSSKKSS